MISRTLSICGTPDSCSITPTLLRASRLFGSSPNSKAFPEVGLRRPRRRLIEVVLAAPLGPSMATTSPSSMRRLTALSASTAPYLFVASTSSAAGIAYRLAIYPNGRNHARQPHHRRGAAATICLEGRPVRRVPVEQPAASRTCAGRAAPRGGPLDRPRAGPAGASVSNGAGDRQGADGGFPTG